MTHRLRLAGPLCALAIACRAHDALPSGGGQPVLPTVTVQDTTIPSVLEAAGVAEPLYAATLSTKLTGTVTEITVREGQRVREGQALARIDARDVAAQRRQADAALAAAEAIDHDAETQVRRMRALYADSAAPKAQLEAAEVGRARAEAALGTARAAAEGVDALETYATIRAPFAGLVTRRFVDRGAFVAPGAPIVAVENASRLRIVVTVGPSALHGLTPGTRLDAVIESSPAMAIVEGIVPATGGALYTINALVDNPADRFLAHGASTLALPQGVRVGLLIPESALVREGDLTGVRVQGVSGPELRWLKVGRVERGTAEVLAGLKPGDRVIVSPAIVGDR